MLAPNTSVSLIFLPFISFTVKQAAIGMALFDTAGLFFARFVSNADGANLACLLARSLDANIEVAWAMRLTLLASRSAYSMEWALTRLASFAKQAAVVPQSNATFQRSWRGDAH